MSGHSHFSTIKHKKGEADAKKSTMFSKIARMITVAVKEGGGDPNANSKLRMAIEKGRSINMPADNIERAIKRGSGDIEGAKYEEVVFEAYGPGNIAVIIEGVTDNKNRTLSEIKQILERNGGKMVSEGAVRWIFERKGIIALPLPDDISKKDDMEIAVIEAGADDISWRDDGLDVYTAVDSLEAVKKKLEEQGLKIESSSWDLVAKEYVAASPKDKEANEKLFGLLDENDAVQEVYSNLAD